MSNATTDVLVVGAGPAGSSAAIWSARAGLDTMLVDAATFPRDKTCGDGLTPRAVSELERLGLGEWLRGHTVNKGLRTHGFGQTLFMEWNGPHLPDWGSAVARTEFDNHLRDRAVEAGAEAIDGARAVDVRFEGNKVAAVVFAREEETFEIACRRLVVADGVRSPLGKKLGRVWHRDTVYAVAGRSYVDSTMSDYPWIVSHLELRDESDEIVSGYGWIFPLGNGQVNLGAGTLATAKRPADIAIKPLMRKYGERVREEFGLAEELRDQTSALLPMGGAVSGVSGPNWALIGDAAACVNPLNGEGIDYGLESGRLVAEMLVDSSDRRDLTDPWRSTLQTRFGPNFSIARRLAGLVTVPWVLPKLGPIGMRSTWLMELAFRWMGNQITDEDRDWAAHAWRLAGRRSTAFDARPPFS